MRRRATNLGVLLIAAAALALRLAGLDAWSLWRDETDTLVFATRELERLLATFTIPGENAPLYFLAMRLWVALTGTSEWALRFPAAAAGAATVSVVVALARWLGGGARASLLAGAFAAANPFLVWYGQEARVYTILTLIVGLLALLLAGEARRPSTSTWWADRRIWAAAALATVTLPLHVLSPLWLAGVAGFAMILAGRRHLGRVLAPLAPAALLALPGAGWQLRVLLEGVPSLYPEVPASDVVGRMATVIAVGLAQPVAWNGVAFVALVALFAANRSRSGLALTVWALLPVGLLIAVNERFPIFLERYLMPVTLPALIAAGLALGRFRVAGPALAALIVAGWLGLIAHPGAFKPDARALAGILPPRPAAIVVAPWWDATVRYYVPDVALIDVPDAAYVDPEVTARLLPALLLGLEEVWLVQIEQDAWDPRGVLAGWLRAHSAATSRWVRQGVIVDRFVLRGPGEM